MNLSKLETAKSTINSTTVSLSEAMNVLNDKIDTNAGETIAKIAETEKVLENITSENEQRDSRIHNLSDRVADMNIRINLLSSRIDDIEKEHEEFLKDYADFARNTVICLIIICIAMIVMSIRGY